jgi:hypothetical protein
LVCFNKILLDNVADNLQAGVGERMISLPSNSNKQQDIQAVGLIMLELMEPGTSSVKVKSINLRDPQKWSKDATSFLRKTFEAATVDSLLRV